MLPNHAPLVIAEQFGTLNTLYPGRIDLGLGRAPGSDQPTMRALRRHMAGDIDASRATWPNWWTGSTRDQTHVRPVPGYGEDPGMAVGLKPLQRAACRPAGTARLRLPSHFRAGYAASGAASLPYALQTVRRYRKPYAMVCINIIAADSNRDAEFLFTSMQQAFVKLRRGETGPSAAGGEYASTVVSFRAVWRTAGAEHVDGRR